MNIHDLILELQMIQFGHGNIDVVVLDEELGEWVDIGSVDKDYVTVLRAESASMHHVVTLTANYDV